MRSTSAAEEREPALVGGRYLVSGTLGEGGVAIVHRARDTITGRDVALKRLRTTPGDRDRAVELFQREFYTLSQLAHPNVVSVHDYGFHEDAPYYTMELLDGGDLLDGVPYKWRTACSLARDVCSALALIHSRRMVYRDLSPKNVRCTSDGRAKLLDFGALAPMGRAKLFVGTPAISAPEAVNLQQLDARTDLYSLGATLYYALSGRRPYPASRLSELYELWKTPPPPPSRFAPDVPKALDELVMELLQVEPALRPASAAETLDRLSGIAGFERDESAHLASNSYLSTPTLVGRDTSLERFRRVMKAALAGTGGAVLVHGPRGVGRTRFLDACVLEAKLGGAVVLRADATDATGGEYAVARALAAQLLEAAPDVARLHAEPKLDVLSRVVPSLAAPESAKSSPQIAVPGSDLQRALREWFIGVATERPLCIAVDDIDRVDLPSAGLVALLAREASERSLLVVTTIPSGESFDRNNALALLRQESRPISLVRLSAARSARLLRSLFGDVPNVEHVANRLQTLSGGLPGDLMQLAQHLVDRGLARYRSGTWSLPRELDAKDLPTNMTQARRARIDALDADARALAQAFALDRAGRFSLGECVLLSGHGDTAKMMRALDELVSAELVTVAGNEYCLSAMGWREPLVQSIDGDAARAVYKKLAQVSARRPGAGLSQTAYLFEAGDEEQGLEALVNFAESSMRSTGSSIELFTQLVQSLPNDWLATFDRGLSLCEKYGRSEADVYTLRARISGICSQLIIDAAPYYAPLFAHAQREADAALRAFLATRESGAANAQASSNAAAALKAAVLRLGQITAGGIGCAAASLSLELLLVVPNLTPFAALAPAFAAWQTLREGVHARLCQQTEIARGLYERQLERLDAPGGAGLDETYRMTQILGISQSLGMVEASMGLPQCLERAKTLDASPLQQVNAVRIRMLYALWQGDVTEADKYKKQAELLAVERARRQTNEGAHLLRELLGHAIMDDLTRVKRTLDAVEPLSHRASAWKTVLLWAESEYQRIRGDATAALAKAEAALASMHPEGHAVWAEVASTRVRLLVMLGRFQEAADAGLEYLARAERRDVGYERHYIRMPLAVALARLDRRAEAEEQADTAIASFIELGITGMSLGLAYETRARVAVTLGKNEDFDRYLKLCATHYRVTSGGPVATRYERLVREERLLNTPPEVAPAKGADENTALGMSTTRMRARLDAKDPERRACAALELLIEESGAEEGVLFRLEGDNLELRARVGDGEVSPAMLFAAQQYMAEQQRADEVTLVTDGDSEIRGEWTMSSGDVYRPVVLCHESEDSIIMTGLALLRSKAGARFRHPASTASHLSRMVWHTEHFSPTET